MKGDSRRAATSSRTLSSILGSRKGKGQNSSHMFLGIVVVEDWPETYEPLISPKLIAEICAFSEGAILRRESRTAWSGKWVMPQSGG
jgi:hypothetical protein